MILTPGVLHAGPHYRPFGRLHRSRRTSCRRVFELQARWCHRVSELQARWQSGTHVDLDLFLYFYSTGKKVNEVFGGAAISGSMPLGSASLAIVLLFPTIYNYLFPS